MMVCPVIPCASSEQSAATAPPTSAGVVARRDGDQPLRLEHRRLHFGGKLVDDAVVRDARAHRVHRDAARRQRDRM